MQQNILSDVRTAVISLNKRSSCLEARRIRQLEDDSRHMRHRLRDTNDRRIAQTEFLATLALSEKNQPTSLQPPAPPSLPHHPYPNVNIFARSTVHCL